MSPPTRPFTVTADSSAHKLLQLGPPFVEFPRFTIQEIQGECDYEGIPIPFSEWLTKRLQVGQPFVIGGFDLLDAWPRPNEADCRSGAVPSFGIERLIELSTDKNIPIHNCSTGRDLSFTLGKFAESARQSYPEFQNLYARDLPCPQEWLEQCQKLLPTEVQWGGRLDLFQWLPACARSEVMMAYVGSEGSSSGFHRCFSSTVALNLLVDTKDNRPVVSIGTDFESQHKYDAFVSARGISPHLDWINLGPDELLKADFPLYCYDQQVGDLVVFPPATAHQIWNPSTLSAKLVWNILHPLSLEVGINHVQPPFNRLCRPDVARTNLSLACAMLSLIQEGSQHSTQLPLPPDLPLLSRLFRQMVHDESIEVGLEATPISLVTLSSGVIATCNFCNTAIWNRHVQCTVCTDFDLCLLCYLNGRSCEHPQSYVWAELVLPEQCTRVLNRAREILGFQSEEPRFVDRRKTLGTAVNDLMKAKATSSSKLCHLCRIDHPEWKGRRCDKCAAFFCYRGLFRHFDMNPTDVMRHQGMWTCPKCSEICNCRCCHFATAYEKSEKPASKRRIKANDSRGKIMGFADNVFDQKRGGRREAGNMLTAAQIAGKKRTLEQDVSVAGTPLQLSKAVELPGLEQESGYLVKEGSEVGITPTYSLPTLLPSVRAITDNSGYIYGHGEGSGYPSGYPYHPGDERHPRARSTASYQPAVYGQTRHVQGGPHTPLPPMLPRSEVSLPTSDTTTSISSFSRSSPSFLHNVTTTPSTTVASPDRSPPKRTTSLPVDHLNLDKAIAQLEAQISTLRKYDDEFVALKLEDSRRMLRNQLNTLELDLDQKKKERGLSLMERLRSEGFAGLADIVGQEVGIAKLEERSGG